MSQVASAHVLLGVRDQLAGPLANAERSIGAFGARVQVSLSRTIGAFGGIATAIFAAGAAMVNSAAEAEQGQAKLAAVLKSTGGVAGYTADQLTEMAGALQLATGVSDDAVVAAQTVLATFTNVRGDVFRGAIESALDMSAVLGTDLNGAILQIGKALNDPLTGITALSRAGVQFNSEQKELIATMLKAGDVVGAQKLILQELQTQMGGAARAAADTFGGRMTILKARVGELGESIGAALIPALDDLGAAAAQGVTWVEQHAESLSAWWTQFKAFGDGVRGYVMPILEDFAKGVVEGITVVQTVIENWRSVWEFSMASVALSALQTFETIAHFLTSTIPTALSYAASVAGSAFDNLANLLKATLENATTNLFNFFEQVTKWLRGEGFDFRWTGLLEGMELTFRELPKFTDRVKSELEKGFEDKTSKSWEKLVTGMGTGLEKNLKNNMDFFFGDGSPEVMGPNLPPGGLPTASDAPFKFTEPKDEKEKKAREEKGMQARIEGLGDLYGRIAAAAAGANKEDKAAAAARDGAEAADRGAKASEKVASGAQEMVKLLQGMLAALQDISSKTPAVGVFGA